jgi:NNP family nitrate/nitrite transporter-like MFS transporter
VLLLLVPTGLVALVLPSGWLAAQGHSTQLWVLLACAATAGVGGGSLGVATCQLLVPLALTV